MITFRFRNPFRARWAVVAELPGRTPHVESRKLYGTFVLRSSAALRIFELEGSGGRGTGQAYAPGILHVVRLP